MAVNSAVALAIATLVFYVLVAPFAVYISIHHGVSRSGPWYFMLLLVLVRIIGEPMTIATNGVLSTDGVSIAGYILSSIGLSPLLLMGGALLQTVNTSLGKSNSAIDPRILRLMALVPLAALIVSSIGSSNIYSDDAGTRATAQSERVAATALYVAYWGLLVFAIFSLYRARALLQEHRAHVFFAAIVASMPFLLVRLLNQCLTTFGTPDSQQANVSNIWMRAFMGSLMEFIVVIITLVAGWLTVGDAKAEKATKAAVGNYEGAGESSEEYEAQRPGQVTGMRAV